MTLEGAWLAPGTLGDVLRRSTEHLAAKGSDTPRLDAELLLAHALGRSRTELYADRNGLPDQGALERFDALLERRVTDHRVKLTVHNLDALLAGELDEMTSALQDAEKRARLEAASA